VADEPVVGFSYAQAKVMLKGGRLLGVIEQAA